MRAESMGWGRTEMEREMWGDNKGERRWRMIAVSRKHSMLGARHQNVHPLLAY